MEKVIEVSNLTKEYRGKKAIDSFFFNPKRKLYNDYWT